MDEPIGDEDSDWTLGDTISDEAAEEAFEDVEQRDFQQAVQAALAQLPDAQRDAIIGEFWFETENQNVIKEEKTKPERGLFKLCQRKSEMRPLLKRC